MPMQVRAAQNTRGRLSHEQTLPELWLFTERKDGEEIDYPRGYAVAAP
jgi:hypothetical protein